MEYTGVSNQAAQCEEEAADLERDLVQEAMSASVTPRLGITRGRRLVAGAILATGALALIVAAAESAGPEARLQTFDADGWVGLSEVSKTTMPIVIRDFYKHDKPTRGHPDMEPADSAVRAGLVKGLVEETLGPDKKPVFKGGKALSTKAAFDQWYNDDPLVNKRVDSEITLTPDGSGKLVFDKHDYFPIDGQGWKDEDPKYKHNYYFTLEAHREFTYNGGETFMFRGDDDLWVFINDKLVIDLGGMHQPESGTVELDSMGLQKGSVNELALFFAERHTSDSNFRVETSIRLDEPPTTTITTTTAATEEQCCLLKVVVFQVGCTPMDEKSWYHLWCM